MAELKNGLAALYRERLKGIYLFGSCACWEARPDSDLDVWIVLDSIPSYSAEVDYTSKPVARVSLDSGVSVSRVFVSEAAWQSRRAGDIRRFLPRRCCIATAGQNQGTARITQLVISM